MRFCAKTLALDITSTNNNATTLKAFLLAINLALLFYRPKLISYQYIFRTIQGSPASLLLASSARSAHAVDAEERACGWAHPAPSEHCRTRSLVRSARERRPHRAESSS